MLTAGELGEPETRHGTRLTMRISRMNHVTRGKLPITLTLLALALLFAPMSLYAHARPSEVQVTKENRPEAVASAGAPATDSPMATDRWTELDLYWFDRDNISKSVSTYLDRMYPVYKNASGWRGVIVNVGWMVDYIAGFSGSLDERIPLPEFNPKQWGLRTPPQLSIAPGTDPDGRRVYPPWTYADLKKLGEEFRRQAASRYGMNDFKFGTLILGWGSIYSSSETGWRAEHPEVYVHHWAQDTSRSLVLGAILRPDSRRYAAFPRGIPNDTPYYRFFARQWGSLSQAVGIDALILRDGMFGQVEYSETGPYGRTGSANPGDMERWNQWTASLVRETKQANPRCLLIGYSTASSAVGEWRIDGFDLEQIAQEGYLDAWIDQSWAGEWNDYWNNAMLGYTFQLSYILVHGAQLAATHTRHYVLIDPWDAWEPPDPLHASPLGVRWEIWAYTHAAVKTPQGDKVPAGIYYSWGNRGDQLWSTEDVSFLSGNSDAATADALRMREALGPTLVYNRDYLAWLNSEFPDVRMKEFVDDDAAMLMKWQVPILSITRLEWLPSVHSDLFILHNPAKLKPEIAKTITGLYNAGKPLAIISDPTWGIDPKLGEILSPPCKTLDYAPRLENGWMPAPQPGITDGLPVPTAFGLWQAAYATTERPQGQVVYQTGSCPDLMVGESAGRHWTWWNPPSFTPNNGGSLEKLIESPTPYILASRSLLKSLNDTGRSPLDAMNRSTRLLTFHWWLRDDGRIEFLAGNLDRDLEGGLETPKTLSLDLPAALASGDKTRMTVRELTGSASVAARVGKDGRWKAEFAVPRNSSSAWILEGK